MSGGIYIPGALVIGKRCGSSAGGADLSDIDFTAATLDSRVRYQRAGELAYLSTDGTLQSAQPNVWPLEYRDGVAAGRHEPEPGVTNAITSLQTEFLTTRQTVDGLTLYTESAGNTYHRLRFNTGETGLIAVSVIYSLVGRDYCCLRATVDSANNYKNIGLTGGEVTYTGAGFSNTRVTEINNGVYLLQTTFNSSTGSIGLVTADTPVTDDTIPRVTTDTSTGFWAGYAQIETGSVATSPASASRSAATATVKNPGGLATSLRLHYSDGTHVDIKAAAGGDFAIPPAVTPWATRYITLAEYFKS